MKQIIVVRTDLKMSVGKMVAQGAHASVSVLSHTDPRHKLLWLNYGQKKVILQAGSLGAILALEAQADIFHLPFYTVKDAGHTELEAGTVTCIAIGPAEDEAIDKITGELKLL